MILRSALAVVLASQLALPAAAVAQVPIRTPGGKLKLQPEPGMPNPKLKPFPVQGGQPPTGAPPVAQVTPPTTPAPTPPPPRPTPQREPPATAGRAGARPEVREAPPEDPEARREQNREAARKRGRFQLDFDKAELSDVIQTISDFTGKLFIVPENIRGKVTIVGPEDGTGFVTAEEAYAAFLSALEANNWTVYPVGRYLKIVEKRAAANNNVWTYLDPDAEVPDDERMITKLLKLRYVDVDTIQNPIKQLLSKDSQLVAIAPDTLILTEIGLNLRRVERIIAALDQPGGGEELRIVQIEYASAGEIAETLLQIFEEKGGTPARGGAAARRGKAPADPGSPTTPGTEGGGVSISRVIPDERTNKLIIVASAKAFDRIDDLIRQLDVPTGDTGRVNVYYLENAAAEDVANTLQALTSGGGGTRQTTTRRRTGAPGQPQAAAPAGAVSAELFEGDVKISADEGTNSLVIVASAQDYKNIVKVIEKLDIPRRQVFVEAVIMEVNLRKQNDFGISLHSGYAIETDDGIAPVVIGSQQGSASSLNLSSLVSLGGFLAGIQGPPVPQVQGLGVNLPSFGVVMHAMARNSDVNVLSTPHILTSDNEEAEITVGQNVPFQAGYAPQGLSNLLGGAVSGGTTGAGASGALAAGLLGGGGLSNFYAPIQRQNVELKLKIKPQINEGDYVRMEVEEQTEEIAEQDPQLGPTTAKRTAKTVIVAKDQNTVVIGGLIQDRTIRSVSKTPILGDIPVLGWLFRDTSTTKIKTNLLLFLTPYIIQDQSDFRRIFERKMKEREEFVAAFYGTPLGYEVPIDYARKSGPLARLTSTVATEAARIEHGGEGVAGERAITPRDFTEEGAPSLRDEAPAPAGSLPGGAPAPAPAPGTAPGTAAPPATIPAPVPEPVSPAPGEER